MLPVIAIIGRANVGKSTLFNCLTKSHLSLVADVEGLTRDRQYSEAWIGNQQVILTDTGGITQNTSNRINTLVQNQTHQAIQEADLILFVVEAKGGALPEDHAIANFLRKQGKSVILVVNKTDRLQEVDHEFHVLGFHTVTISAAQGQVKGVLTAILDHLPPPRTPTLTSSTPHITIAVLGRPNAGKSTLINQLLGQERVIVDEQPGTTRDSIHVFVQSQGETFVFIDTAGVRRRTKIKDPIEQKSVIQAMQSIQAADAVVFVLNAKEPVTDQDLRLLNLILLNGVPLTVAINQCDTLTPSQLKTLKLDIEHKFPYLSFIPQLFISALTGQGVHKIYPTIKKIVTCANKDLPTGALTKTLEKALIKHPPPLVKGRRIRLRYAHLGKRRPLTIVIHGKQTANIPSDYRRYLVNFFQTTHGLVGTPLNLKFKTDINPYQVEPDQ